MIHLWDAARLWLWIHPWWHATILFGTPVLISTILGLWGHHHSHEANRLSGENNRLSRETQLNHSANNGIRVALLIAACCWAIRTRIAVVVTLISMASILCLAQVSMISSDEVMDAAFDMKKASEAADKLRPDGSKYCKWGAPSLDTSDLEVAITRFLLDRGSRVPETVAASKMWHVSSVAGDIIHQLAMGSAQCDLRFRFSENNKRLDVTGDFCTKRNERESTWRKSWSCRRRGHLQQLADAGERAKHFSW
jgi:hypothetical protein